MDFRFTPEQEALRREFEEFCQEAMKEAPPGWESGEVDSESDEGWAFHRKMTRKMGEKGYLTLAWPKEYGGRGLTPIEQLIFAEVRAYYGVPGWDAYGLGMVAPMLLEHGTEEQKRKHLPGIAKGEVVWCELWSEPNAGSDLASLTTQGLEDGDDYIINGQKRWTTNATRADWGHMLVRTEPELRRSRGISFFLVDMKSSGITIEPYKMMYDAWEYDVFFDNVRVPKENLVGEKNNGWEVTRTTMNFQRSNVGRFVEARRNLEELAQFCKETKRNGKPLNRDPLVRHRLAQLFIEAEAGRTFAYRIAWTQEKGGTAFHEASMSKLFASELIQRVTYFGLQLMGPCGQVKTGSKWAPLHGKYEHLYQFNSVRTLAAGTSEIQRNLIAWTGLGLPRI